MTSSPSAPDPSAPATSSGRHPRRPRTRHLVRFTLGITGYVVILVGALLLFGPLGAGALWAGAALALIPIGLIAGAVVGLFRDATASARTQQGEAFAVALGITAPVLAAVGVFETAGFPHLNWAWAYAVTMVSWIVGVIVTRFRSR